MLTVLAKPVPAPLRDGGRTNKSAAEELNLEDPAVGDAALPARLCTLPSFQQHGRFLQESLELILRQAVFGATDRTSKVSGHSNVPILDN